jgi:hypothetical protein
VCAHRSNIIRKERHPWLRGMAPLPKQALELAYPRRVVAGMLGFYVNTLGTNKLRHLDSCLWKSGTSTLNSRGPAPHTNSVADECRSLGLGTQTYARVPNSNPNNPNRHGNCRQPHASGDMDADFRTEVSAQSHCASCCNCRQTRVMHAEALGTRDTYLQT